MTIGTINIDEAIASIQQQIVEDATLSPAMTQSINILILVIQLLVEKLGLNSSNSSIPPSKNPNRKKVTRSAKKNSGKKPGGQLGHSGSTLTQFDNPDDIIELEIDKRTLPNRDDLKKVEPEVRQVVDVVLKYTVTEYQAEVWQDSDGSQYTAAFPEHVTKAIQYGPTVKALAGYLSQYQLIPYNRVQQVFDDHFGLQISQGTLTNFNKEAYQRLAGFETKLIETLKKANLAHADETGIKVGRKNHWLHVICTSKSTFLFAHESRGTEAMDAMGVLKHFKQTLCHDHWKPYLTYDCRHSLCNAHHLRELEWVVEFKNQKWAKKMQNLLCEIRDATEKSGGKLSNKNQAAYIKKYRSIIRSGRGECPILLPTKGSGRKRVAQTKERNLLDRLSSYEDETLLFMKEKEVSFTNNQAERDIRMAKVHQKVSGCFRSMNGARYFCRIRSYLLTSVKRGHSAFAQIVKLFEPEEPILAE